MDLKQIEKLMAAMEHSRIKRIMLKREDYEIEIERECALKGSDASLSSAYVAPASAPEPILKVMQASSEIKDEKNGLYVLSPMVGTFYASPSPEDPPFVKPGDVVNEETVVCIIEAMKVMNEVKSGIKGTISEILLKNGEPVEFGSRLFKIIS